MHLLKLVLICADGAQVPADGKAPFLHWVKLLLLPDFRCHSPYASKLPKEDISHFTSINPCTFHTSIIHATNLLLQVMLLRSAQEPQKSEWNSIVRNCGGKRNIVLLIFPSHNIQCLAPFIIGRQICLFYCPQTDNAVQDCSLSLQILVQIYGNRALWAC